ncbi:MAG: sulfatase-like hydrolase/transferase [Acidobacteriota bacterium]|nr:sulfatase-like hydrolase/transferase [Acidobacteriota bacterium]
MISRRQAMNVLAGGFASIPALAQTKGARKPNFVIIVADDLGYGDIGCYGSPDVPTPNIDSIAADGIRFTSGYVSAPVCSPSRAALLTGRYQQRFGHEHNCGGAARDLKEHLGLPLTEVTLPQTLKGAGYVTGMVGKWHLGMNQEFHPMSRGFDDYFGFLAGANSYLLKSSHGGLDVDVREGDNMGIFDERRQPIYVDRFANIKDERHRMLAAMTSALDDNVGKVLASLRSSGLEKDTLVIFISDNGSPTYTRAGTNRPLNGGKLTLYEGGFRVPFMAKWPGKIQPRQVVNTPVTSRDLFPALVEAAGAVVPGDRKLDGVDLMPHLAGGFKQGQSMSLCSGETARTAQCAAAIGS